MDPKVTWDQLLCAYERGDWDATWAMRYYSALDESTCNGGNYFEYRCEVPASDLDAGFRDAYLTAMPASGLVPRDGQHLEVYGEEYDPNAPIARFRILIPVV